MRNSLLLSSFAAAVSSLGLLSGGLLGCSGQAPVEVETIAPPAPTPFTDTTGQAAATTEAYPAGPYGFTAGQVIPNMDFLGFPDPAKNTSAMKTITLADFYNPHGLDPSYTPPAGEADDRLFPASSGYENAGKPKPVVLLVDVASVWCGPCNEEAETVLPFKHALYEACGGEFLLDLHDSATPGTTATQSNLKNWTVVYKVDYPSMIDPAYKLDAYFSQNAYPTNMIIDTTTMTIVHVIAGEAIPGFCNDANQETCGTPADLAVCSGDSSLDCAGLSGCTGTTTCTQYDFWTTFESKLDKTRAGCTLQ
jgi:hypothetical protein